MTPGRGAVPLDQLEPLIGDWEMEASFPAGFFGPGTPAGTGRGGRTTFAWLDGRFFVTQRFISGHPAAPSGIAIIGAGTEPGVLMQHYYDSRGVARVYQMRFEDRVWRLWRTGPPFAQRYTGVLAPAGDRIDGAWEIARDGADWRPDFALNYLRVG